MRPWLPSPLTVLPGTLNPSGFLPHPNPVPAGTILRLPVADGIALIHMARIHEGLPFLDQLAVEGDRIAGGVPLLDHLRHEAAVAIGGLRTQADGRAGGQLGLEPGAAGRSPGRLIELGGIDAGQSDRAGLPLKTHLDRITIGHPDHRGIQSGFLLKARRLTARMHGRGKQAGGKLGPQGGGRKQQGSQEQRQGQPQNDRNR